MLKEGTLATFFTLIALIVTYIYFVSRVRKGFVPEMRPIAAIEALEEQVGRAVEMGRPVHFTTGQSAEVTHARFSNVLSGLKILSYLVELCVKKGADLLVSEAKQTIFPIAQEIVRSAYQRHGIIDKFTPETVQFVGGQYKGRIVGNLERYNVAANIYVGDIGATAWMIGEVAARIGATQIAGTPNDSNMVVLIATSDYTLLGDEQYAAGAILSGKPSDLASVLTFDYFKLLTIALMLLVFISTMLGNSWIVNILRL